MAVKIRSYSDDEYYTTPEAAEAFFEKVVQPSGILKRKQIAMPFSSVDSPLFKAAQNYHKNVVPFEGDMDFWKYVDDFEDDVAVIDNPPFSMSSQIKQYYFSKEIPFVLFRSSVAYPKNIFRQDRAGIIYENSKNGVRFAWGIAKHVEHDDYIKRKYPNLLDNLRSAGILEKEVPIGFSYYLTDYDFKVKTVTFTELGRPLTKKDSFMYVQKGIYDENTEIFESPEDGRIHLISK